VAEVYARRNGSPLDSVLRLTDSRGRRIAYNDDFEDKSAGLIMHQADSYIDTILPGNDIYTLTLRDIQNHGGKDFVYRLRVGGPRPDFDLRIVPSEIAIRAGYSAAFTVYAFRKDDFSGAIDLKLVNPPDGIALSGGRIPEKLDSVRLTLTAPQSSDNYPVSLQMIGRASIGAGTVEHLALPAEDMMQAFAYRHIVPEQEWIALVTGGPNRRLILTPALQRVSLSPGKQNIVRYNVAGGGLPGSLILKASEPDGVAIQKVDIDKNGIGFILTADPLKVKPGLAGNIIIEAFMTVKTDPKNGKPASTRQVPLGTLPAMPFEVTAK
jgi:hypothetical protein